MKSYEIKTNTGYHRLICGDCLEVMKSLPAESIDLIIADPPYNVGIDYGAYKDNPSKLDEYLEWCKAWISECARLLKKEGSIYLFNYPENNALLFPFISQKLFFRRWLVWHYPTNIGHSPKNWTRSHRSIIFAAKTRDYKFNKEAVAVPYRNPNDKRIKKRKEEGSPGRTPYDVFTFNLVKNVSKWKNNINHPCLIPKELIKTFILASSDEGDTVLDPFAGSFTTTFAALELNRSSIGIEINPDFVKDAYKRLKSTLTGFL
ncbi:MAG: DNA-methyltransferase [Candidatus Methanospirareceae archaeon]